MRPRMMRSLSSPLVACNCPEAPSRMSPRTSSAAAGVLVPMPTDPVEVMVIASRTMLPPERALTMEKCGLPGEPNPTHAVSVPRLFR